MVHSSNSIESLDNRERQKAINSSITPIYEFNKNVLDLAELIVTQKCIKMLTGFDFSMDSDLKGKYVSLLFLSS